MAYPCGAAKGNPQYEVTFTVGYDAAGRPRGTTYPNGMIRNQRYDNAGHPTYLDWGAGSNYVFETAYDTAGRTAHTSGGTGDQQYRYDNAGRLIQVADTQPNTAGTTAACTTRAYTFDRTSNRNALTTYPDGTGGTSTGGSCTTSSTPATTAATFDDTDRITTTGYSYDNLGRTLTLPASDAIGAGPTATVTGALSAGYYDNDMVATLTQGGQTRSYTLDPSHDRIATIDDGATQHLNTYNGASDNPAWTLTQPTAAPARTPENTTWQRHVQGPDGLLAGTQNSTGTVSWNITDPQGSTIATTPGTSTTPSPGSTWTEYGTPRNPNQAGTYGWLSNHRRSTDTLGGLTLMGVRLYNPTTGRFLTTDPIYGGNANPYIYPADPINNTDLDGQHRKRKRRGPCPDGFCYIGPGNNAGPPSGWVYGNYVKRSIRRQTQIDGNSRGCHTCGATSPGTRGGKWITDHQFPQSISKPPYAIYPHCAACSARQGGFMSAIRRFGGMGFSLGGMGGGRGYTIR